MMLRGVVLSLALCAESAVCAAPPEVWRADAEPTSGVCGLWRVGADGAVFSVKEAEAEGCYSLTLVDSPDYTVTPGTEFGRLAHTGTRHVFDASLQTSLSGRQKKSLRLDYTVEYLPAEQALVFRHYNKGWTVNVLRVLPYLFRISATRRNERPEGIDAARRIGPAAQPTYLYL
ncbi:MAG: hypothetical protein K2L75_05755 [Muribaculaceae bacterium]|nr:hypothetical protein [Muribaculaceae bacterium]